MTTDFDPRDHGLDPRTTLARVSEGGECRRTSPGHLVHFIQARLLNTKPCLLYTSPSPRDRG